MAWHAKTVWSNGKVIVGCQRNDPLFFISRHALEKKVRVLRPEGPHLPPEFWYEWSERSFFIYRTRRFDNPSILVYECHKKCQLVWPAWWQKNWSAGEWLAIQTLVLLWAGSASKAVANTWVSKRLQIDPHLVGNRFFLRIENIRLLLYFALFEIPNSTPSVCQDWRSNCLTDLKVSCKIGSFDSNLFVKNVACFFAEKMGV